MTQEREAFEAAYSAAYPWTVENTPDCFEQTASGNYEITGVMVGWRMWQARASLAQPASPTIQDLAAGAHYPQATGWSNPTPNAAANAGTAAASASVGVAQPASVPADGIDYEKLVADAWSLHKYRCGTPTCIAFKNGAEWQAKQAPQPAQAVPQLTGCNCRWDGETQVQWCELHLAHKGAIHDWAGRAKNAEAKLPAPQPEAQPHQGEFKTLDPDIAKFISDNLWDLAAPSAQAEPIAALVDESERLGLYDVPPLADLREKLGGWDVPEVSGKQAEQGGK